MASVVESFANWVMGEPTNSASEVGPTPSQVKAAFTTRVTALESAVRAYHSKYAVGRGSATELEGIKTQVNNTRTALQNAAGWLDTGSGYDSGSNLLRRVNAIHADLIARYSKDVEGRPRVAPGVVDSQGRVIQKSPTKAGVEEFVTQLMPGRPGMPTALDNWLGNIEKAIKLAGVVVVVAGAGYVAFQLWSAYSLNKKLSRLTKDDDTEDN